MRDPTALQSACIAAAVLTALALGTALAPAHAAATSGSKADVETATVEPTGATPPHASLVARYPADGAMVERTVVSAADVARVGAPANDSRTGAWTVATTLTGDGAANFTDALVDTGFAVRRRR